MTEEISSRRVVKKRLRAHVDFQEMSVSYGRVKLGVPVGFREMLETVTRELLREQPRDIPAYLAAYFTHMNLNRKKGIKMHALVTERVVEVGKTAEAETQESPEVVETEAMETQTEIAEEVKTPETEETEENEVLDVENDDSQHDSSRRGTIIERNSATSVGAVELSFEEQCKLDAEKYLASNTVSATTSKDSLKSNSEEQVDTSMTTTDAVIKESITNLSEELSSHEINQVADTNPENASPVDSTASLGPELSELQPSTLDLASSDANVAANADENSEQVASETKIVESEEIQPEEVLNEEEKESEVQNQAEGSNEEEKESEVQDQAEGEQETPETEEISEESGQAEEENATEIEDQPSENTEEGQNQETIENVPASEETETTKVDELSVEKEESHSEMPVVSAEESVTNQTD